VKQLYPFVALSVMLAGGYFFFTQFKIDRDGRLTQRSQSDPSLPKAKKSSGAIADTLNKLGDSIRDTLDPQHSKGTTAKRSSTGQASTARRYDDDYDDPRSGSSRSGSARSGSARSGSSRAELDPRDYPSQNARRNRSYDDPTYADSNRRNAQRPSTDPYDDYGTTRYGQNGYGTGASQAGYNRRVTPSGSSSAPQTIRIATFNIQVFGEKKLEDRRVVSILAEIVKNFDIVAIQEVRSQNQDVIPRFLDFVNASGRRYRDVLGPREGRTSSKEQYAFIYDSDTILCDHSSVYVIDDPDDMLHRPPLVAPFACRNAPREQAFTFTLINAHTDPDMAKEECDVMDDVIRAVRNDGRGEDDIILLGDFNAGPKQMRHLSMMPQVGFVVTTQTTNVRERKTYDNIIFNRAATTEYIGKGGVFDFRRYYNLRSEEEALTVSDHYPVWAEYSIYENGAEHRVARTGTTW
jgi:deoxyribonuclease-1-like protein